MSDCSAVEDRRAAPPGPQPLEALRPLSAASYLPRRVADAYASAGPHPKPPCTSPLRTVLLFADVCGYSRLTRWLAQTSDDGGFATSVLLNTVRQKTANFFASRDWDTHRRRVC